MWGAYSYLFLDAQYQSDFNLMQTYNKYKHQIPLLIKNKIIKRLTASLGHDDSSISIHVNRKKAKDFIENGKIDDKGEQTVFSQVMKGLQAGNYQGMRINSADKKAWFVKFIGELALDQGGLFRESLTELCNELQTPSLNLLIPTQNQKSNQGESRDKWTINPTASSIAHSKMFEFLGALIGMSVRSSILMSLNLSSFVWKQLTDEEVTIDDLKDIDFMAVNILDQLREVKAQVSEEEFLQGYELFFTTILSNGEEIDLLPGGKSKRVDYSNL